MRKYIVSVLVPLMCAVLSACSAVGGGLASTEGSSNLPADSVGSTAVSSFVLALP